MALEIPYEDGVMMPAYLYLPAPAKRLGGPGLNSTPVVVHVGGGDAAQGMASRNMATDRSAAASSRGSWLDHDSIKPAALA